MMNRKFKEGKITENNSQKKDLGEVPYATSPWDLLTYLIVSLFSALSQCHE